MQLPEEEYVELYLEDFHLISDSISVPFGPTDVRDDLEDADIVIQSSQYIK